MLRWEMVTGVDRLSVHRREWDQLAGQAGRPLLLSAWAPAWWRHMQPAGAELRVVLVFDRQRLIGVAPLFVRNGRARWFGEYRPIGNISTFARLEPLAAAGFEQGVAGAIVGALAGATPPVGSLRFDGIDVESPWPARLAQAWRKHGGAATHRGPTASAPVLGPSGKSYAEWLASKSSNFRWQARSARRSLERAGGTVRPALPAETDQDLRALARLHRARWSQRGSPVADSELRLLLEAVNELGAADHVRFPTVRHGNQLIGGAVFAACGGVVSLLYTAFDPAYARYRPGFQAVLAAIEDGCSRRDHLIDFGPPAAPYKARLADGDSRIFSVVLVPHTRSPLARLRVVAQQTLRRLPDATQRRAISLLRHGR